MKFIEIILCLHVFPPFLNIEQILHPPLCKRIELQVSLEQCERCFYFSNLIDVGMEGLDEEDHFRDLELIRAR